MIEKIDTAYSHSLPSDYRLSDYKILHVLGQGAFGITYLAQDLQLNIKVAIKEYFPREFSSRDNTQTVRATGSKEEKEHFYWGLKRFLEEARVLALFDHPNIVHVRRFFEWNGTAYLVMDYCDGMPLDQIVKNNEVINQERLLKIIIPLLDALETVHKSNFLHRDIKPGNIFIRRDGVPVLLDFGAARHEIVTHSKSVTSLVTPGYGAFEQYSTRGLQGPWTDIYGFGSTLYRLVTGERPDDAASRMLEDTVVSSAIICKGKFDDSILNGIDAAMKVSPKDRPQSIEAWRKYFLSSRQQSISQKTSHDMPAKTITDSTLLSDVNDEYPKPQSSNLKFGVSGKFNRKSAVKIVLVCTYVGIFIFIFFIRESNNYGESVQPTILSAQVSEVLDNRDQKVELPLKESKSQVCPRDLDFQKWDNCVGQANVMIRGPNGDNKVGSYNGAFQLGRPSGLGTVKYSNGESYTGSLVAGELSGKGYYSTGENPPSSYNFKVYDGQFLHGKMSGKAKVLFKDGSNYEGDVVNGIKAGTGIYKGFNGDVYTGEWLNDIENGFGKYTWKNGDKFIGNFSNNEKIRGEFTWKESDKVSFNGTFSNNGLSDGTLIYKDGTKFIGKFNNNIPSDGYYIDSSGNRMSIDAWSHRNDKQARSVENSPKNSNYVDSATCAGFNDSNFKSYFSHSAVPAELVSVLCESTYPKSHVVYIIHEFNRFNYDEVLKDFVCGIYLKNHLSEYSIRFNIISRNQESLNIRAYSLADC